ncbi:alkylated DNA repair protein alkB homolog 8-like [Dysidea avara]|uniref:alkylated DNA repair protein alkB homolog 8-like n=1 Tax=Dysidea avara TaxID=196820 RepID=UPI003323F2BD
MSDAKVVKKQKRSQLQLLSQEDKLNIQFLTTPSRIVCISNGGVAAGIPHYLLQHVLSLYNIKTLITPSGKQFAFALFDSESHSVKAVSTLNGHTIQELCKDKAFLTDSLLKGPPLCLYLSYIVEIPTEFTTEIRSPPILSPGLTLIPEYISTSEEQLLQNFFSFTVNRPHNDSGNSTASTVEAELKLRKVVHYGYEFNYTTNNVDPTKPLLGGLPEVCTPVIDRIMCNNLITAKPDQLTVNQYLPGQGIPPHIDTHSAFEDGIVSLTLGSHTVMDFKDQYDGRKISVLLPQRSLLVMSGESRYKWTHGITPRKLDIMSVKLAEDMKQSDHLKNEQVLNLIENFIISDDNRSTVVERSVRTSLTFRKLRCYPCTCGYSLVCDSAV